MSKTGFSIQEKVYRQKIRPNLARVETFKRRDARVFLDLFTVKLKSPERRSHYVETVVRATPVIRMSFDWK